MRFAPEIHTCFARRCATHRRNRITNNEEEGVDPQEYIKGMEELIQSDPNCNPEDNSFFSHTQSSLINQSQSLRL